jgi:hypothetical protein
VILPEAAFHDGVSAMSCRVCGLENCDGSCLSAQSSHDRLRQAALEVAERRHRQSPGDTLPDYEDEDEDDRDDELDEDQEDQSEA